MASSVSVWLAAALTKKFENGQRMMESKIENCKNFIVEKSKYANICTVEKS